MAALLLGLALVLLLLSATGAASRRVGLTGIPAYILLGVLTNAAPIGHETIELVQAIGVSLLLFFVGLEFSVLRIRERARHLTAAGAIDLGVNFPVGLAVGLLLGWGIAASFLLGAALYISSSAIVARNISLLRRAANPESEIALGTLVAEDLVIAVGLALFAVWIPVPGLAVSVWVTLAAVGGLAVVVITLAGPLARLLEKLFSEAGDEVLLLGMLGLLLLFGAGALFAGLSEAVGAFVAGLLVGGSRIKDRVDALLGPFQELFAALFFFAFGLGIDASLLLGGTVLVGGLLAVLGIASKAISGLWVGRRAGLSVACSLNLGFTLSPRGEFSVVIAAYGAAAGQPELVPVVAVVVVILAVVGSLLTQAGPRVGTAVERWHAERSGRAAA